MENGIPALMIAAILMLSTVFIARGGFIGMDAVGQSLKQQETTIGQQNRTGLTVTGTSIDGTGSNLTITVRNDGQTPVSQWDEMDIVLQYFGEAGGRFDKWIPYTAGPLGADTWTTGSFANDIFEPGILNTGESVDLLVRVNPAVAAGSTNWAIIGTEKGVTVQTYFNGP
ncbi:MAG TPA: hypothetical protein VFC53_04295 [Dehalococcoidia bacterium]|nr:hypothetical protein [Dehalococcoidia bacterium]